MSKVFLRKQGLGLDTIRSIMNEMQTTFRIARVDIRSQPIPHGGSDSVAINWGTMASPSDYHVFNKPFAIEKSSNKGKFRKALYNNGLAPFTTLDTNVPEDKFPVVVRPLRHFGGNNLTVANNTTELLTALQRNAYASGFYVSTLVKKSKEFRVFVAQDRVVYVVNKIPDDVNAVAWNVHQGGRFENVRFGSWDINVVKASLNAMRLTDLDFGAVDVIVSETGDVYVLEVNTAPALSSPYWITCVAKAFDYMAENRDRIEVDMNGTSWKNFVHPAISSDAITTIPLPAVEPQTVVYELDFSELPEIRTHQALSSKSDVRNEFNHMTLDNEFTYIYKRDHHIIIKFEFSHETPDVSSNTLTKTYKAIITKHKKLEWVVTPVEIGA